MIRVTIELLPGGWEGNKREIGRLEIVNDGTGDSVRGNYYSRMFRKGSSSTVTRRGEVKNFARLSRTAYELVYLALKDLLNVK